MTASTSHTQHSSVHGTQHLVLLGASHAHLQVLARLAAQPLLQTQVVLVAPHPSPMVRSMLAGFAAGHYSPQECTIPLEPLVQRSGVRWVDRSAVAIDMTRQTLQLDDGSSLAFDWLSVDPGPVQDRTSIESILPGAREHALFTHPAEAFAALWPRVVAMGEERALRIAVIGTGAEGAELALATRHRLPNAAVTLVCGSTPTAAQYAPAVQRRLMAVLKKQGVTVLQDDAKSLRSDSVQLGCGADLACDVPILVGHTHAPLWIAHSGLALDPMGYPAVDVYRRSTSHSRVFADCDGMALIHNLTSAMAGTVLKPLKPPSPPLQILSCGGRYAVGSWRSFSAQGRWVWWLKDWLDRGQVARCVRPGS